MPLYSILGGGTLTTLLPCNSWPSALLQQTILPPVCYHLLLGQHYIFSLRASVFLSASHSYQPLYRYYATLHLSLHEHAYIDDGT